MAERLSFEQGLPAEEKIDHRTEKRKKKIRRILKYIMLYGMSAQELLAAGGIMKEKGKLPPLPTMLEKVFETGHKEIEFVESHVDPDGYYLKCCYGQELLAELEQGWRTARHRDKNALKASASQEMAVADFDTLGFDQEQFRTSTLASYPEHWVSTEIDSIIFKDEVGKMPKEYGIKGKSLANAVTRGSGVTKVNLYQATGTDIFTINNIFAHESGHANDWNTDNNLTAQERKQLLLEVTRRYFTGANVFHSDYVESISNDDQNMENYLKITEYWAEICTAYFTNSDYFQEENPQDYELVHHWVTKQDPDFDPVVAAMKRAYINWHVQDHRQLPITWEADFTEALGWSQISKKEDAKQFNDRHHEIDRIYWVLKQWYENRQDNTSESKG